MEYNVKVKKLIEEVKVPDYATEGSAGFDLRAMRVMMLFKSSNKKVDLGEKMVRTIQSGVITLRPGERVLFGTGLSFAIPVGKEMQIRDKSGISLKKGLKVLNAPGTIDSDFRGEVGVIIYNTTTTLVTVTLGEKIAQGVICSYDKVTFNEVDDLDETDRGDGGYGSTGLD